MAELVSTIIPTYNRAALLVRVLDSVAAQGYRPIEVVIIDDGSTDNTVETVAARRSYLADRGIDVIFHQQQNQKAPKARNVGMKLARGSLFAFLDSDDLWLPTFLETVVRLLDQHPDCGMGFSGILGIDDNDVVFAERKMYLEPDPVEGVLNKPFNRIIRYMPTQTSGVVVRRSVIDDVGDFDLTLPVVEDWDLWYRIGKKYSMCYTTRALACNRSHPDNLPKHDTLALSGNIKMNLRHLPDVTNPFSREVLINRIHKQITLLQEQVMREGKEANGYMPLLYNELSPETWRFALGTLIREQPMWVGRMYAWIIRALGEYQRNEWVKRLGRYGTVTAGVSGGILNGLRLLIVADSSTTHTHRWAHWARDAGAVVTVLSPFDDPIEGVRVAKFPPARKWYHKIPKARMVLDLLPFRRLIREIDPQLIHFHFVSEGGRAFYWNNVRVPMVASTWGQDVIFDKGPDPKAQGSLKKMLARCRAVTATTYQLARETARYTDRPIYIVPFGVDLRRFEVREAATRLSSSKSSGEDVVLGFVKWLKPKYGPDVMVEAFARIHAQRPKTRLVLAGKGEMQDQLQARVNELGLASSVQILGRVDHEKVPALIRSFDIMVMPSVYESETFGVAAIEASASGVPVVASRVGGVPEAVIHEKTGLLVPPRDVEALARACVRLIDDANLRREMGLAGRRFVERYYSWPENTRLMGEVYRAAVEGSSVRSVPVYQAGSEPGLVVPPLPQA